MFNNYSYSKTLWFARKVKWSSNIIVSFDMLKNMRRASALGFPRRRTLNPKTLNFRWLAPGVRQHRFFFDGFKALQLEDTTAHDAFSLRLALVYLLVVWAPFFWLFSAISFVAYIFTFLSLAHVLHGALLYFFLLFLLRRARPTRLFMVPLFVCRALSFSVPCPSQIGRGAAGGSCCLNPRILTTLKAFDPTLKSLKP